MGEVRALGEQWAESDVWALGYAGPGDRLSPGLSWRLLLSFAAQDPLSFVAAFL